MGRFISTINGLSLAANRNRFFRDWSDAHAIQIADIVAGYLGKNTRQKNEVAKEYAFYKSVIALQNKEREAEAERLRALAASAFEWTARSGSEGSKGYRFVEAIPEYPTLEKYIKKTGQSVRLVVPPTVSLADQYEIKSILNTVDDWKSRNRFIEWAQSLGSELR